MRKGTLFLDEIAELDIELQAKLLRVIEDKELYRLGTTKTSKIDVRIIASTFPCPRSNGGKPHPGRKNIGDRLKVLVGTSF